VGIRDRQRAFVKSFAVRLRARPALAPLVVALVFTCLVSLKGVPAVRHDWSWNADASTFFSNVWSSWGGWFAYGIGSPRPYPADYLTSVVITLLVRIVGPLTAYVVTMFAIGFACAAGAVRLASRFCRVDWSTSLAFSLFATLNPWVYNKVVAGHIFMVLAYAATMFVLAEFASSRPSPLRVLLFSLLTLQQLQFFIPVCIAVVVWSIARRAFLVPGALLLAVLPIAIGVVGNWTYLHTIPYTAAWQADASVAPAAALALSGYFAQYADALGWFTIDSMWLVGVLFALGVAAAWRKRRSLALVLAVGATAIWLLATGAKGFAGPAYLWIEQHASASGLYRELYDLIGFLAIAYLIGTALSIGRFAQLRWIFLIVGLVLTGAWIGMPPTSFWVASASIPRLDIGAPENTRFALLPALQPMSFAGEGSGINPDAVVRPGNVVPLNTPEFSFPESSALMSYEVTGDARWLAALSVSRVLVLPYFHSDAATLRFQEALPLPKSIAPVRSQALAYLPQLTLAGVPSVDSLPAPPWENRIFFGDAALADGADVPQEWHQMPRVIPIVPPEGAVAASDGWVDARAAFVSMPDLAQGLGGAVTTNRDALLRVDPSAQALVYVRGRLEDAAGAVLSSSTAGYAWIDLRRANAVRCLGLCVVAAQASKPAQSAAQPQAGCTSTLQFSQPASWLAVAELPPAPTCLLRYNVRFDPHWSAYRGLRRMAHVAIDSTFNGWIVPAHDGSYRIVMVQTVAALQWLAQIAAIAGLVLIFVRIER
jgi:hypothetical protein